MNWFDPSITPADIARECSDNTFSDNGEAKIFAPTSGGVAINLSDWLASEDRNREGHESGNICLIPYDDEGVELAASRDDLTQLANIWGIPPVIFQNILDKARYVTHQICQFTTRQGIRWLSYPIQFSAHSRGFTNWSHCTLTVVFTLKVPGYDPENSVPILNTLVVSPKTFIAGTEKAIRECGQLKNSGNHHLDTLRLIVVLLDAILETWCYYFKVIGLTLDADVLHFLTSIIWAVFAY
jgi:hypothetical protein